MTDSSADSSNIVDCRSRRAPDTPGIPKIGGANKSTNRV
jgi:hypothetical protein